MNEAWRTKYNLCVGRLGQTYRFYTSFWIMRSGLSIVLQNTSFFSERFHFLFECVLSEVQLAATAFPTKRKWVERRGNAIATIMSHCDARNKNFIMKWLSSLTYNQSSLCCGYIPIAFSVYLINSLPCFTLSALLWS